MHLPINSPANFSAIRTVALNFATGRSLEDRQNLNYKVGGRSPFGWIDQAEFDAGLSGAFDFVLVPFLLIWRRFDRCYYQFFLAPNLTFICQDISILPYTADFNWVKYIHPTRPIGYPPRTSGRVGEGCTQFRCKALLNSAVETYLHKRNQCV